MRNFLIALVALCVMSSAAHAQLAEAPASEFTCNYAPYNGDPPTPPAPATGYTVSQCLSFMSRWYLLYPGFQNPPVKPCLPVDVTEIGWNGPGVVPAQLMATIPNATQVGAQPVGVCIKSVTSVGSTYHPEHLVCPGDSVAEPGDPGHCYCPDKVLGALTVHSSWWSSFRMCMPAGFDWESSPSTPPLSPGKPL